MLSVCVVWCVNVSSTRINAVLNSFPKYEKKDTESIYTFVSVTSHYYCLDNHKTVWSTI